jgi:hypothetical protein
MRRVAQDRAAARRQAGDDADGALARRRWQHLPDPVRWEDLTTTQPVPRGPEATREDELQRLLLLMTGTS